ncbi:tautomerase family protein [Cohnella panacarvi]|uniref:tautomerase family protein n=1 Tax=Cohnella panacarvi TaxID=400776 RepID=UPI00047BFE88|nr:tautomerase family protein [Cohnella panacarvi]
MPLIQVDLNRSVFEDKGKGISNAIHQSLIAGLGMDPTDLFQVFRPHGEGEIIFSPTYDNRDRRDLIIIRITMVQMFSLEQKKTTYKELTKRLVDIGIRRDDILVCVVENSAENWSLGEREA